MKGPQKSLFSDPYSSKLSFLINFPGLFCNIFQFHSISQFSPALFATFSDFWRTGVLNPIVSPALFATFSVFLHYWVWLGITVSAVLFWDSWSQKLLKWFERKDKETEELDLLKEILHLLITQGSSFLKLLFPEIGSSQTFVASR